VLSPAGVPSSAFPPLPLAAQGTGGAHPGSFPAVLPAQGTGGVHPGGASGGQAPEEDPGCAQDQTSGSTQSIISTMSNMSNTSNMSSSNTSSSSHSTASHSSAGHSTAGHTAAGHSTGGRSATAHSTGSALGSGMSGVWGVESLAGGLQEGSGASQVQDRRGAHAGSAVAGAGAMGGQRHASGMPRRTGRALQARGQGMPAATGGAVERFRGHCCLQWQWHYPRHCDCV